MSEKRRKTIIWIDIILLILAWVGMVCCAGNTVLFGLCILCSLILLFGINIWLSIWLSTENPKALNHQMTRDFVVIQIEKQIEQGALKKIDLHDAKIIHNILKKYDDSTWTVI